MKLFLSVPFTSRVLPDGTVDPVYKQQLQQVIGMLRAAGHDVFCSLEHANWQLGGLTDPAEEFRTDLAQIDTADRLVVLLEERISAGIQIELGYSYAKGKELDVYQIGKPAWSNTSFLALANTPIKPVNDIESFIKLLSAVY